MTALGNIGVALIEMVFACLYVFVILINDAAPGISASPSEDNMRHFNVMILGPSQSPYEGNFFFLSLLH